MANPSDQIPSSQYFPSTQESETQMPDNPDVTEVPRRSVPPPKMLTSEIFTKHYTKGEAVNEYCQVACNYCSKVYKWKVKGGYGTLQTHMANVHPEKLGISRGQTQLSHGFASSTSHSPLFTYNHSEESLGLTDVICSHSLPFSYAEYEEVREYNTRYLQPSFKPTSRKTVSKLVTKSYLKKKEIFFIEFG